jgi:hypothetical protein
MRNQTFQPFQTFTFEHFLYIFIFLLALGVRVIALGDLPLSDYEADHAIRAVQVSRGEPTELGTQPVYVLLTGLTFFLLGSSEAAARLWPVLAGSALVLFPLLLRDKLGRKAAIVVAFGLALDPGLVSLSQLAGGPMMAVSFVLLAAATWLSGWAIAAGILGGLAFLSGPAVVAGAVGLAATVGIVRILGLFPDEDRQISEEESPSSGTGMSSNRAGLLAAGGTLLLAGTLFLRYPQGLSALAASLPAYFEGWVVSPNVPVTRLLISLVIYPLLAVIFGVIAAVRAWMGNDQSARIGRALSIWLVVTLLFALLYPGRQVADLVWTLIPLWGLAGLESGRYLQAEKGDFIPWTLAGLVVVMLTSVWTNLGGLAATNAQGQVLVLRWLVIGGAVLLAILSAVLVGLGWSSDAAKRGLAWGTAIALGFGMFASIWGATQRELTARMELWKPLPGAGQQSLLLQTLGDLGDWTTGREDSLQIISLVDAPSVRWALRDLPNVRFQDGLSRDDLPEAIITLQDQAELSLGSAYRGQDFVWWVYPNWDTWSGIDWLKWLAFRNGAGASQGIIVWGRGDLFPSGEAGLEEEIPFEIDLTEEGEEFIPEEEIIEREDPLK